MLLTLGQVRQHVETDLNDTALQMLIDAAESDIIDACGELNSEIEEFHDETLATLLFLKRKAVSVTSVIEQVKSGNDYEATTLLANDYALRHNNCMIERLADGDNPRGTWGDIVTITYEPEDERTRRKAAVIKLVKLETEYSHASSVRTGDHSETAKDYTSERAKIINALKPYRVE